MASRAASRVLSLRVDEELWGRIRAHAARRGMSVQDYVVRALVRDDFDQRFMASVEETDRFYAAAAPGMAPPPAPGADPVPGAAAEGGRGGLADRGQTRPNAGIR
jgi:hypothetical protein